MSWRDDPYADRWRADRRGDEPLGRLRRWLATRPTESWVFFAAGFVLAALLT